MEMYTVEALKTTGQEYVLGMGSKETMQALYDAFKTGTRNTDLLREEGEPMLLMLIKHTLDESGAIVSTDTEDYDQI